MLNFTDSFCCSITQKQITNRKNPVVCSCHFNDTNSFPIPYYEIKRKLQSSLDVSDSEPVQKNLKVEFLEMEPDQSQCDWLDFGPEEIDLPEQHEKNIDFAIEVEKSEVVVFEQISELSGPELSL